MIILIIFILRLVKATDCVAVPTEHFGSANTDGV